MRKDKQLIQDLLDGLIITSEQRKNSLDHESRIDFGGQIRGVASALAILRNTSAMDETTNAMKRLGYA